jgi:hypothetical protein
MLIPIMKAEQTMSRRFLQEHDGIIICSIMWHRQNAMTPKYAVQLRVQNLATNTTIAYLLEENDLISSYVKLYLEKGDYILTLNNISGRGIKAINIVTSMKGAWKVF